MDKHIREDGDNCFTCEFCMYDMDDVMICAGRTKEYGMPVDLLQVMFPNGCEEWEMSFFEFCRRMDAAKG